MFSFHLLSYSGPSETKEQIYTHTDQNYKNRWFSSAAYIVILNWRCYHLVNQHNISECSVAVWFDSLTSLTTHHNAVATDIPDHISVFLLLIILFSFHGRRNSARNPHSIFITFTPDFLKRHSSFSCFYRLYNSYTENEHEKCQ